MLKILVFRAGALTLLEFKLNCRDGETKDLLLWIGYCAFHQGNYHRACNAYKELIDAHDVTHEVYLLLAVCYFYQQMYEEAEKAAENGPESSLKTRLLFNIAHRTTDEAKLMAFHQQLKDKKEDQLSLASIHYLRGHFQEVSIYECFDDRFLYAYSHQGNGRLQKTTTRKSR